MFYIHKQTGELQFFHKSISIDNEAWEKIDKEPPGKNIDEKLRHRWDKGQGKFKSPKKSEQFSLTSNRKDLPADGTSTTKIKVQKLTESGNPATGQSHNDKLKLETTAGRLSELDIQLSAGKKEVTLTSSNETVKAVITLKDRDFNKVLGQITIRFTP